MTRMEIGDNRPRVNTEGLLETERITEEWKGITSIGPAFAEVHDSPM